MKLLANIVKSEITGFAPSSHLVHFIASSQGYLPLPEPKMANEIECPFCGNQDYATWIAEPLHENKRIWFCGRVCAGSTLPKDMKATIPPPNPRRALEWALFCEINGIGDLHQDVKFENVKQSDGKIAYMLKFAATPRGILHMQGDPGTGKTYAALAVCELFTRKNSSCIFTTQKQMAKNWLDNVRSDGFNTYIDKVTKCNLLVIDDFGTADIPPGFMAFFMDLIDTRMQWSNRGTIVTTNLDKKKFALYCGEALTDRMNTSQVFEFKGKSRRMADVL